MDQATVAQLAELFKTLGDMSRIRMIGGLVQGELHVAALAECAGISESAVSHHLRHLRQMRLVRTRKDGRYVFYALDDEHVKELFLRGLEHIQHG